MLALVLVLVLGLVLVLVFSVGDGFGFGFGYSFGFGYGFGFDCGFGFAIGDGFGFGFWFLVLLLVLVLVLILEVAGFGRSVADGNAGFPLCVVAPPHKLQRFGDTGGPHRTPKSRTGTQGAGGRANVKPKPQSQTCLRHVWDMVGTCLAHKEYDEQPGEPKRQGLKQATTKDGNGGLPSSACCHTARGVVRSGLQNWGNSVLQPDFIANKWGIFSLSSVGRAARLTAPVCFVFGEVTLQGCIRAARLTVVFGGGVLGKSRLQGCTVDCWKRSAKSPSRDAFAKSSE